MKRPWWRTVVLIAALLQVLLAAFWWITDDGKSAWTEEQAMALQEAGGTLHKLAGHGHEQENHLGVQQPDDQDYNRAAAQFSDLSTQFENAKSRRNRVAGWLLVSAGCFFAFGVAGRMRKVGN
jgi:hypothetical protein